MWIKRTMLGLLLYALAVGVQAGMALDDRPVPARAPDARTSDKSAARIVAERLPGRWAILPPAPFPEDARFAFGVVGVLALTGLSIRRRV